MSYITAEHHTLPDEILHPPKCPKLPNQSTTNRQRSGADEIITSTICSSHPTDHRRCNPHFTLSENKYVCSPNTNTVQIQIHICDPHFTLKTNMYRLQFGFPTKDALPRHRAYLKKEKGFVVVLASKKCPEENVPR